MLPKNKSGSTIKCLVLFIILITSSTIAFAGGQLASTPSEGVAGEEGTRSQSDSTFHYESHLVKAAEIENLKAVIGVRNPEKNYNVLIDGYGTGLAPPTEAEWQQMIGNLMLVDDVMDPLLEPAVDHSQELYFPPVRSQQTQGSCAAWSVAYYTNGYLQARDMNWTDASTGNNDHLMSPAWAYNKANGGYDSGSSLSGNMLVIMTAGNAVWSTMPYDPSDATSWGDESAWRSAPPFRGRNYQWTNPANTDVIKSWIAEGYVLPIALDAGNYARGLGNGDDTINSTEHITGNSNHANTIVGYNDSKTDDGEVGAFKIVNSWGKSWGSEWGGNGYYWMTYEALKELPWPVFRFRDIVDYEPSLLGVWNLNPQGGRNASVILGIGPRDAPLMTRQPWWLGGDHDFPSFMALDYTDFKNEWRLGHSTFFLDIGIGKNYSTITSYKMELYESGYSPGSYTRVSNESHDVPEDTPGYVTVSIYPSMRITNPLDGDPVNSFVNITGWATNPLWTVVLNENFEGSWPGGWFLGDNASLGGKDYWGVSNYRSYEGSWSGWSAQFGDVHETAYHEDFDNGGFLPTEWTTYSAGPDSHPWEMKFDFGSDYFAECNSSEAGVGTDITEWLQMTSGFDASSFSSLNLTFYLDYQDYDGDEYASVLYSDSTSYPAFTALRTWTSNAEGNQSVDLSAAAGDSAVYLAFLYHGTYDRHMRVDDAHVSGGVPNEYKRQYDHDMDAFMHHEIDLSGYDSATLMYKYWLDSESGVDYLYFTYYDGIWHFLGSHTGNSGGWQASTISIPTTATKIGFHFHSDDSLQAEGAYVDDILLLGHGAIDEVYVKIDDGMWELANGTMEWYYEWNTTTLQEGHHRIYARAYFGSNFTEDFVTVTVDHSLPINPDIYSSSHAPTVWSNDETVWIRWFGAWDNISGVYGFAVEWTIDPTTIPAEVVSTTDTQTTSDPLVDGNSWYVHIRTVDRAGNWAVGAFHAGPFYIDTAPPDNPNSYASSHQIGVWSSDDTIYIEWAGASDLLSGVYGYSYTWTMLPTTLPVTIIGTIGTNTTSLPLGTSDSWYFHVRTRDVAGNWAPDAYHVGPFYLDVTGPSTNHTFLGTEGEFGWYVSNVSLVLSPSDGHSGVDLTMYRIDGSPWSEYVSPPNIIDDGNHTVEYYSVDAVGNNETVRTGNVSIDATAPLNPDSYTSSHGIGTWSEDDTIDINWTGAWDETSGVYGYSFSWTRSPSTLPDMALNSTTASTTSPSLPTGNDWYFHVRTRDVAGNWAPDAYHVGPFCIDVSPPSTLDEVWADLEGVGWRNVNISWTFASDLESGVQRYDIYYGTQYDASGAGYVLIGSVPAVTNYFVHLNAGEGDQNNYFYLVEAVDFANNSASYSNQAGKFVRHLAGGWQLVSIALEQRNESPEAVLRTLDFDTVRSYFAGEWKSYFPQKSYCGLKQIGTDMGIWIHVVRDSNLTLAGRVPTMTDISLARGWNLVGYPSFSNSYTVTDLKADLNALRVEVYDEFSPPFFLRISNDFEILTAGMGYWIEVSQSGKWTVVNEAGSSQDPKGSGDDGGLTSLPPDMGGSSTDLDSDGSLPGIVGESFQTARVVQSQAYGDLSSFLLCTLILIGLAIPYGIRYRRAKK
ncbi:MAG: OmpL47-type beta-barrel domain-containing protein [Thermoplasmata archaeon]